MRIRHGITSSAVYPAQLKSITLPCGLRNFARSRCLKLLTGIARFFFGLTFPQLPEALQLIKAWGFVYKTVAFVWLKQNRKALTWFYGLGFWTRSNAEICLLATKGHPKRQSAGIHQLVISPVEQHSKKPDEVREKIVSIDGRCASD